MSGTGIFEIARIVIGAAGTILTGPIGGVDVPPGEFAQAIQERPAGYVAHITHADGTDGGTMRSPRPIATDISTLPPIFLNAVLAAEDQGFLEHSGIDTIGLAMAAIDTARGRVRGGSTITQQMVKNRVTGSARSLDRKVAEAVVSLRVEAAMNKIQIMEAYLESAWFGRGSPGVMRASADWFGKDWSEIDPAEAALLAALLKGPAYYDPVAHPDRAKARRDHILSRMEANGWLSSEDAERARNQDVSVLPSAPMAVAGGWSQTAIDQSMRALPGRVAEVPIDLEIVSTIMPAWQRIAEDVVRERIGALAHSLPLGHIPKMDLDAATPEKLAGMIARAAPVSAGAERLLLLEKKGKALWSASMLAADGTLRPVDVRLDLNSHDPEVGDIYLSDGEEDGVRRGVGVTEFQAAAVILDPRDGAILASVGGTDFRTSSFDRTHAMRQPGSAVKPFLYLAALERGIQAWDLVADVEQSYTDANGAIWKPQNYDLSQAGLIPMFTALEHSSNLAAAQLIDELGPYALAQTAEAAGAYEPGGVALNLSSALGSSETSLVDLVSGFGTLMNDGIPRDPIAIREIRQKGVLLDSLPPRLPARPIASRASLEDLAAMMRGVVVRGTASDAFSKHPVTIIGKTGTTQAHRDAWFVGVTPHLAIGIWIGRDDNKPLPGKIAGGSNAAPIAAEILKRALEEDLVSASGLRDDKITSSLTWPPSPFKEDRLSGTSVGSDPQSGNAYVPGEWDRPDAGSYFGEENPNADLLGSW